ncbi:MAG: hypothetical protein KDD70_02190, partial [Bdellovibrionales bacterium]|nr:hypothetical protein [Bdellovibrionales bacterium]
LFMFGNNGRSARNIPLYQFNLRLNTKGNMVLDSFVRAKWDSPQSEISSRGHTDQCIAKRPDGVTLSSHDSETFLVNRNLQSEATLRVLDLVVEMDTAFSTMFGSDAVSQISTVFNAMEVIYERDLGITLNLQIGTTPITISSAVGSDALDEYSGVSHAFSGDLYHLYSAEEAGGLLGIAYLGVVCAAPSFSTGITYHTDTAEDILTAAHEIGHNFNAEHDDATDNPPTIMYSSSASNLISEFSDISKGQISTFVSGNGSCMDTTESGSGGGSSTPTPSSSPTPTGTPGGTIDDPSEGTVDGELFVDLYSFRFQGKTFLGVETYTEDDLSPSTSVEIYYKRRRKQSYELFTADSTDEDGELYVRARKGYYFAQSGDSQSEEVRVRRGR